MVLVATIYCILGFVKISDVTIIKLNHKWLHKEYFMFIRTAAH